MRGLSLAQALALALVQVLVPVREQASGRERRQGLPVPARRCQAAQEPEGPRVPVWRRAASRVPRAPGAVRTRTASTRQPAREYRGLPARRQEEPAPGPAPRQRQALSAQASWVPARAREAAQRRPARPEASAARPERRKVPALALPAELPASAPKEPGRGERPTAPEPRASAPPGRELPAMPEPRAAQAVRAAQVPARAGQEQAVSQVTAVWRARACLRWIRQAAARAPGATSRSHPVRQVPRERA